MCGPLMKRYAATVEKTEYVSDDVVVIYFSLSKKSDFSYEAGQYITIYFKGSSTPAGKAYSLSSAPHEKLCQITVKRVGEFSGKLYALKVSDTFEMSEAYGHFDPKTTRPLIAFGAGVGIAPIWSILKQELKKDESRVAHLFYTNKTAETIAHRETIDSHASQYSSFSVHHYVTRTQNASAGTHKGRIDLDACVGVVRDEANYLICGSVDFVRDMWRGLVERGIPQELISTETFFE